MKIHNEIFLLKNKDIKRDYTISLISDIHNTKYSRYEVWTSLIQKVNEQKPDIIIIAGDMFYDSDDLLYKRGMAKLEYLLYGLLNIAPVYLNYGNHDQKDGKKTKKDKIDRYFKNLAEKENRFTILNNDVIDYKDLSIIGVTPVYETYYLKYKDKWLKYFTDQLSKVKDNIKNNKFNILITHTPEVIGNTVDVMDKENKKILNKIDLFLSGHFHDGLTPRFLQKLIVKKDKGICASEGETLFKNSTIRIVNKCRGIHELYNGKLIISRGVRKWCHPNSFFAFVDRFMSKDITTIKIKKV